MVDHDAFSEERPYTPEIFPDREQAWLLKAEYSAPGKRATGLDRALRHWLRKRYPNRWRDAWAIEDTGSTMFARYWQGEAIANECLVPVFYAGDYRRRKLVRGWRNRLFEAIMPDYMRHWGRDPKTYTRTGGFLPRTEYTAMWEEFLWQGEIFGFHMRGHPRHQARDRDAEVETVRTVLNERVSALAMP